MSFRLRIQLHQCMGRRCRAGKKIQNGIPFFYIGHFYNCPLKLHRLWIAEYVFPAKQICHTVICPLVMPKLLMRPPIRRTLPFLFPFGLVIFFPRHSIPAFWEINPAFLQISFVRFLVPHPFLVQDFSGRRHNLIPAPALARACFPEIGRASCRERV